MRPGLKYPAEARVFILMTDPSDYSKKEFIQFTGFDQISSLLTMSGVGTATISFPNKDMRYLKGILRPSWAQKVGEEIDLLKMAYAKFGMESSEPAMQIPKGYINQGKLLMPRIGPFDLVWIDYRGRDGRWYPGFTGIVTGYKETVRPEQTPVFVVTAKDLRRLLQFTPIITGLNNLSAVTNLETILTGSQMGDPAIENIFSTYPNPTSIISDVLDTINQMLKLSGTVENEVIEQFWQYNMFGSFTVYNYGNINDFNPFQGRQANDVGQDAYYKDPLGGSWYDELFALPEEPTVYKFMVRAALDLFTIDIQNAQQILQQIANSTMSFIYLDQAGNLRYEYPRYATVPSLNSDYTMAGELAGVIDEETPWNALNYWVSSQDEHFLNYVGGEDESEMTATRVVVSQSIQALQQLPQAVQVLEFSGYATMPPADLVRYGLRETRVAPFYSRFQISKDIMDLYAQAVLTHLNRQSRSFVITMRQRPDTMLNRSMVFLDRARVGLITSISDTYSQNTGHVRSHTCQFARYLGELIEYPWRDILNDLLENWKAELAG